MRTILAVGILGLASVSAQTYGAENNELTFADNYLADAPTVTATPVEEEDHKTLKERLEDAKLKAAQWAARAKEFGAWCGTKPRAVPGKVKEVVDKVTDKVQKAVEKVEERIGADNQLAEVEEEDKTWRERFEAAKKQAAEWAAKVKELAKKTIHDKAHALHEKAHEATGIKHGEVSGKVKEVAGKLVESGLKIAHDKAHQLTGTKHEETAEKEKMIHDLAHKLTGTKHDETVEKAKEIVDKVTDKVQKGVEKVEQRIGADNQLDEVLDPEEHLPTGTIWRERLEAAKKRAAQWAEKSKERLRLAHEKAHELAGTKHADNE